MSNLPIGVQVALLLLTGFMLFRATMKLPKKVAIGFIIFFVLAMGTIVLMAIYYTATLVHWFSLVGVQLEV